jgi:hypothetical protein
MNWEMISAVGQMLGPIEGHYFDHLSCCPNPQSKQGKPARSGECFDDALERFE